MAKEEQLEILKSGVQKWNVWRRNNEGVSVDLSGADLRNIVLSEDKDYSRVAYLDEGDFRILTMNGEWPNRFTDKEDFNADPRFAFVSGADLHDANLRGAILTGTQLGNVDMRRADLTDIYLSGADLTYTYLTSADLRRADLCQSTLQETRFVDVDLSQTIGLNACQHSGPSVLDHRTLMRSGRLPLAFLRGCGLPDGLIEYLPSLLGAAFEFHSCFISYSSKDQDFADRLHKDLQAKGVRCWFAPHNVQAGKKVHEQIDEAIRFYDKLLLILSPASMESEWVKTEIAKARKREIRERRRMLFPLRLIDFDTLRDWECFDADTGKDSAREIREFFIPDFSRWKTDHEAYTQAFDRLLRDLQMEKQASSRA